MKQRINNGEKKRRNAKTQTQEIKRETVGMYVIIVKHRITVWVCKK